MVLTPDVVARLRDALVERAGGFLRNPIREHRVTCAVCTTPCVGYELCAPCRGQLQVPGQRADQVAALTYAINTGQAAYVMHGYKASPPVQEHAVVVALVGLVGLSLHAECAGRRLGVAITHWSTIPSLPTKNREHPLRGLIAAAAPGQEVAMTAAMTVTSTRSVDPNHFRIDELPQGAHLLLVDDTWVGGGHAQSAALAARAAGAARVSVLVLARWIDPRWEVAEYGNNDRFMAQRCTRDYDPDVCPWTGGACPA